MLRLAINQARQARPCLLLADKQAGFPHVAPLHMWLPGQVYSDRQSMALLLPHASQAREQENEGHDLTCTPLAPSNVRRTLRCWLQGR
jgi:hypothetical protein